MSAVTRFRPRQTARWLELVYGSEPDLDDPAEGYHEASKISPFQIARQIEGARRLESSPELQVSSIRAVKRLGGALSSLPPAAALEMTVADAVRRRSSRRTFADGPVTGDALAALLHAGYGVTHVLEADPGAPVVPLRSVPSGGALYPLEVFLAVLRIDGLEPGLYHFDPLRARLECIRAGIGSDEVAALSTYPGIVAGCAVFFLIAAVFGRTRFKYGLRGYRFALLEAGHVAQNLVLAATALDLACVPLGGFYDRRTDEFLGLDGVNESAVYTIAVGAADGR
jgi:SagB-type dehydrogenase family enzyme